MGSTFDGNDMSNPADAGDEYFEDWREREAIAEAMLPMIGHLYREHGVMTTIYERPLIRQSAIGILRAHRFAKQFTERALSVRDTMPVLEVLTRLDLASSAIDIARLAVKIAPVIEKGGDFETAVSSHLESVLTGRAPLIAKPRDVVLYGFGRIGRLLTRILIEQIGGGDKLRLRAVVLRKCSPEDLVKRASLLRRDSVHGRFHGTIMVDQEKQAIIANGNTIRIIQASSPEDVDYTAYGIDDAILIDNTGMWRDRESLSRHLRPGISKVILTAPAKGDVANVVYGINNELLTDDEQVFSAASCTTNAIVPVLKVVHDTFGIASGHVESCHSYTNDQNLIDNYHNKSRRGRSAPLNMVITETGAAKAVVKALPALDGKLTGNAIRVPTPNVSLAILSLALDRETTVEELNRSLRDASLEGDLHQQIDYTNSPDVVSSDFVGSEFACVVDSQATIVAGSRCNLYVWYDNEYGYSHQVVKMIDHLAGLVIPSLP